MGKSKSLVVTVTPKALEATCQLKSFSFVNKAGGTGMSNWDFDPKFSGEALVKITKSWSDYECGQRFHGEAISPDLIQYLAENANADDRRVFFSEFEAV